MDIDQAEGFTKMRLTKAMNADTRAKRNDDHGWWLLLLLIVTNACKTNWLDMISNSNSDVLP